MTFNDIMGSLRRLYGKPPTPAELGIEPEYHAAVLTKLDEGLTGFSTAVQSLRDARVSPFSMFAQERVPGSPNRYLGTWSASVLHDEKKTRMIFYQRHSSGEGAQVVIEQAAGSEVPRASYSPPYQRPTGGGMNRYGCLASAVAPFANGVAALWGFYGQEGTGRQVLDTIAQGIGFQGYIPSSIGELFFTVTATTAAAMLLPPIGAVSIDAAMRRLGGEDVFSLTERSLFTMLDEERRHGALEDIVRSGELLTNTACVVYEQETRAALTAREERAKFLAEQ